ncbi:MAG: UDP-4-amino-4,6-dideoxy-N-acetyl-beta-L-altrosamine transaminase [Pseudomonadota bacterium]
MTSLPYGRHTIDEDDIAAVNRVLTSDWLTTGPAVGNFEDALERSLGARHAVAVSNGTAALHCAYKALGIGPGDAVVVPAITFVATANAVRMTGADVVFADTDPETGLMTAQTLEDALASTKRDVKAVTVVHLGGQPVDLAAISALCKSKGLFLVEDACHAIGSTYKDSIIGDCHYSDVATFSFHPVKTIAMGEGGAVTTGDAAIAEHIRTLRHHSLTAPTGMGTSAPWLRTMDDLGYNYRACDIQCALGESQLSKLDYFTQVRRALVDQYRVTLDALGAQAAINPIKVETEPCFHLAQVKIDFQAMGTTRADVMESLRKAGIHTQVHYYPVSAQPYYTDLYGVTDTPGAWAYYDQTLSLPLHAGMTPSDANFVCRTLHSILSKEEISACA